MTKREASGTNHNGEAPESIGNRISEWVSDTAARPMVQLGFIIFCISWFALGLSTNLLTAALSIIAITLTQMVLNRQNDREMDAHRRDVAMHAKLDELLIAKRGARNELAGIEELEEEEIAQLKPDPKTAAAAQQPNMAGSLDGNDDPEPEKA
jgi:low affinity Fe/Cu permease